MESLILNFEDLDPESLNGVIVRKHNDLIEARYQLPNLKEQQVIMMLLAKIKPEDEDFKGYRITVSDFAKTFGLNTKKVYEDMERVTRSLRCREVGIRNGKSFFYTGWLSSVEYIHGSGYVELCFDPKLKPYLLQLKDHFTQYKLDTVLHFKSVYAIRLYELLKKEAQIVERYQKKKNFEKEFSYKFLREAFGIGAKEYKLFADFRRKTIEPAVTEIYDKTELNIYDMVYKKTGRAVSHIVFKVELRSKADAEVRAVQIRLDEQPKEGNRKEKVKQKLIELGYSQEYASRDVNKYGIQRIERSIAYTLAMQKAGKVENFPAYLFTVIEGDLGGAWEQAVTEKKAKAEQAKKEAEEKARKEKEEEEAQKEANRKTLECFYAFPIEVQEMIKKNFEKTIQDNSFIFPRWKEEEKQGGNPIELLLVKFSFIQFLREKNICK